MPTVSGTVTDTSGNVSAWLASWTVGGAAQGPLLGVYSDTDYPWPNVQISSTYYQPGQRINRAAGALELARQARNTSVQITFTWKNTDDLPDRQWIAAIAQGPSHGQYAAASAAMDNAVADSVWLASRRPDLWVLASLEHEFQVKINQGDLTGASADPVNIGKAQAEWNRRIQVAKAAAGGPQNLLSAWWIVGYNRTTEGACMAQANGPSPFDILLVDPYATQGQTSLAQFAAADVTWLRSQPSYRPGQRVGLGEVGMPASFGDAKYSQLLTNLKGQMTALDLWSGVVFNRKKDNNNAFAGPQATTQLVATIAAFDDSLRG